MADNSFKLFMWLNEQCDILSNGDAKKTAEKFNDEQTLFTLLLAHIALMETRLKETLIELGHYKHEPLQKAVERILEVLRKEKV